MLKRLLPIAALICLATAPAWAQSAQSYNCSSYNPNPAGQFCINTGSGSTWVYPGGDLAYQYGILCSPTNAQKCGAYTVKGLENTPFNGTLANGQTWCFNSVDGFLEPCTVGSVALTGVVVGPSGANQFNSTNTAGNTMNNAFVVSNPNGYNTFQPDLPMTLDVEAGPVIGETGALMAMWSVTHHLVADLPPCPSADTFATDVMDCTNGNPPVGGGSGLSPCGVTCVAGAWQMTGISYDGPVGLQVFHNPADHPHAASFIISDFGDGPAMILFSQQDSPSNQVELLNPISGDAVTFDVLTPGRMSADTIVGNDNDAFDTAPSFPNGAGIAITIASGYPPCDGGENLNAPGFVVDAASCADGVQPSGGGGTHCPVFCDGVKWRALYTVTASTPLPSPTPTPTPTPTQTPTATPTP